MVCCFFFKQKTAYEMRISDWSSDVCSSDLPMALIESFVHGIGVVVARHPWLPPLWVREVLCEGGALREVLFAEGVPGVPQLLARRFAAAQADGRLNAGLDPRLLVVSLVGLTLFPAAGAAIWRRVFGADGLGTAPARDRVWPYGESSSV